MMKNIFKRFFSSTLDELFLNVSSSNTAISLIGKDLFSESSFALKDLIIRPDLFDILLQPIQLVSGYLGSANIEGIAEMMLGGKLRVQLDTLYLLFRIDDKIDAERAQVLKKLLIEMSCRDLSDDLIADFFKKMQESYMPGRSNIDEALKPDVLKKRSIIIKALRFIFNNILLSIKNVHIRFEHVNTDLHSFQSTKGPIDSGDKYCALGISALQIKVLPVSSTSKGGGITSPELALNLSIKSFQLYLDYNVASYCNFSRGNISGHRKATSESTQHLHDLNSSSFPFHFQVAKEFSDRSKDIHTALIPPTIDIWQISLDLSFLSPSSASSDCWIAINANINLPKLHFAVDHRQVNALASMIEQLSVNKMRLIRLQRVRGIFGKKFRSPIVSEASESTYILPQMLFHIPENKVDSKRATSSPLSSSSSPAAQNVLRKPYVFVNYPKDTIIPDGEFLSVVKLLKLRVGPVLWKRAMWRYTFRLIVDDLRHNSCIAKWKTLIKSAAMRKQYVHLLDKVMYAAPAPEDVMVGLQSKLFDLEMTLDINAIRMYRRLAAFLHGARLYNLSLASSSETKSSTTAAISTTATTATTATTSYAYSGQNKHSTAPVPTLAPSTTPSISKSKLEKLKLQFSWADVIAVHCALVNAGYSSNFDIDNRTPRGYSSNSSRRSSSNIGSNSSNSGSNNSSSGSNNNSSNNSSNNSNSSSINNNSGSSNKQLNSKPPRQPNIRNDEEDSIFSDAISFFSTIGNSIESTISGNSSNNGNSGGNSSGNSNGNRSRSGMDDSDQNGSSIFAKADIQFISDLFGRFTMNSRGNTTSTAISNSTATYIKETAGGPLGIPSNRAIASQHAVIELVDSVLKLRPAPLLILPPMFTISVSSILIQLREALPLISIEDIPKRRRNLIEIKIEGFHISAERLGSQLFSPNFTSSVGGCINETAKNIQNFMYLLGTLFQLKISIESACFSMYVYNNKTHLHATGGSSDVDEKESITGSDLSGSDLGLGLGLGIFGVASSAGDDTIATNGDCDGNGNDRDDDVGAGAVGAENKVLSPPKSISTRPSVSHSTTTAATTGTTTATAPATSTTTNTTTSTTTNTHKQLNISSSNSKGAAMQSTRTQHPILLDSKGNGRKDFEIANIPVLTSHGSESFFLANLVLANGSSKEQSKNTKSSQDTSDKSSKNSFDVQVLFGACDVTVNDQVVASFLESAQDFDNFLFACNSLFESSLSSSTNSAMFLHRKIYSQCKTSGRDNAGKLHLNSPSSPPPSAFTSLSKRKMIYFSSISKVIVPDIMSVTVKSPKVKANVFTSYIIKHIVSNFIRVCVEHVDVSVATQRVGGISETSDASQCHSSIEELLKITALLRQLFAPLPSSSSSSSTEDSVLGKGLNSILRDSRSSGAGTRAGTSLQDGAVVTVLSTMSSFKRSGRGIELSGFGVEAFVPMAEEVWIQAIAVLLAILS